MSFVNIYFDTLECSFDEKITELSLVCKNRYPCQYHINFKNVILFECQLRKSFYFHAVDNKYHLRGIDMLLGETTFNV